MESSNGRIIKIKIVSAIKSRHVQCDMEAWYGNGVIKLVSLASLWLSCCICAGSIFLATNLKFLPPGIQAKAVALVPLLRQTHPSSETAAGQTKEFSSVSQEYVLRSDGSHGGWHIAFKRFCLPSCMPKQPTLHHASCS
ncbi:hypothetical protein ACLOJK_031921 [Asimina triloba]